ncbi:hypothetical protein Ddc_22008 [Ditylenchus destructor]|nr:hypothetical protein Ddc_22008 [Ditylenchus destructor]
MAQGQRHGGMPRELWSDSKNSPNGPKSNTLSNTFCHVERPAPSMRWSGLKFGDSSAKSGRSTGSGPTLGPPRLLQ